MSLTAALEHGLNRNWYGYLSAFSVADPIFVQGDKEDRASAIKLVFPEFPTQAAEHDPVPRCTGEIWGSPSLCGSQHTLQLQQGTL